MGILKQAVSSPLKAKVFDPATSLDLQNVVGWRTLGGSSAYGFYKDNQFENGYSSISKLGNGFASIEQYTIDGNGNAVSSNVLDRLYTPNTDMSAYDFREALAVCYLVHDKVRLRVHYRTTRLNAESITGFTFMEDYSETIVGGKRQYKMSNGDDLTDEEVITIKSVNPMGVTDGFSPSRAARRWTRLDDYIADYQKGFFENGAIPQGQLIITARTSTEYNDIVDMLQRRHKGAGKNNNVTYTHRPTDQNGAPMNSQIEWVPFSSENKNMGLKELFEQVNQKIDSVYGVPAEIRGLLSNSNYASVAVAEKVFVKYALSPMTMKIWSKFTHELNRVTGGAGVAVTYDLEIPKIADEEKVRAEAKGVDATTVTNLIGQGFTLESAVEYIKTGELSALVKALPPKDEPEVLSPEEAKDTPEQPIDAFAKAFDVVNAKLDALAQPKEKEPLKQKVLDISNRREYENQLGDVVKTRMTKQIEKFIKQYDGITKAISEDDPIEEVEDKLLTAEMLSVLTSLLLFQGGIEHETNALILYEAGINTENIKPFQLTPAQKTEFNRYVEKVARGYNDETGEKIRNVIRMGREADLSAFQIKNNLRALIDEEYRIRRIAVTEINQAGAKSSLYSMQEIAEQTGASVEKIWTHGGGDDPCPYCDALIGSTAGLDQDFVSLGQEVIGSDGSTFLNSFEARDSGGLHPNCHCGPTYQVIRGSKSVNREAQYLKTIKELKTKLLDMDGRTKEAKKLKEKLAETELYITQLESIIDGQG